MNIDDKNENLVHETLSHEKLRAVTTLPNANEPLALLDCGELSFLISSKAIVTLIPAQKILSPTVEQACGALEFEHQNIPVFAFNKALQLQNTLPVNQLTLVVLQHQTRLFALCCAALEKIEILDLQFFPVPINMSSRKQPFTQFSIINNRAAGLTNAQNLVRLLELRGVVFSAVASGPNKRMQEAS